MNYFSIDYVIIYAFIAISLTIGIRAGRKVKDVADYILANRSLGKWAISLSYVTTSISGGGILATSTKTYSEWIIAGVAIVVTFMMYVVAGIFLVPKIAHFKNCLTLGDLIASMYGEKSKLVTGILGFLTVICRAGMDLIILGTFCDMVLYIKGSWAIVVGGFVLAIYAAHGGIKSIVTTDVSQFLILLGITPIFVYFVLHAAGGIEAVFTQLATQDLPITGSENFSDYLTYFLVWNLFPLGIVSNPATMQRLLMARNEKELKEQSLLAAVFAPLFKIATMLLVFAGFIIYPNIPDNMLVAHIMQVLLPAGLKGLAMVSLLAVNMSITSSCLHAAGFSIIHDVIKPICNKRNVQINELAGIRWATILVGSIPIMLSLLYHDVYKLFIIPFGLCGPLLMFPSLAGIMGLKPDKQAFYLALISTIITFSLCELLLPTSQVCYTILLTITINGLTFFGTHLIKNKGFAIINRTAGREMLWRPRKKSFMASLKQITFTPTHLIKCAQDLTSQSGNPYTLFGIFLAINYLIPYPLWANTPLPYQHTMLVVRLVGGILCGSLILQGKWPKAWMPYLPIFWYVTILFCIPFTNTLMYLISNSRIEWLISSLCFTVFLFILLDWISLLAISTLGIGLGLVYFKLLGGEIGFSTSFMNKYLLIYQLIFCWVASIVFLRRKQLVFNKLATQRDYFKYIQQDTGSRLVETLKYREGLLKELDAQQIAIFDDVTAAYIKQAIYRITDYLRLDVKTIILDDFLDKVGEIPKLQDFITPPEVYMQHATSIKEIQADEHKLYDVLVNSISYIQEHNLHNNPIKIILEDALLGHTIAHMKDYTKKLEALQITITTEDELPLKKDIYMIDSSKISTPSHHEAKQLPLVENARIIDAHYGYIHVTLPHTHTYVIPVNLRKIRGKVMELLTEPVEADQDELNHPLAIELEKQLFDKLNGTQVDLAVIQKALLIIKKYHGGVKRKSGEPFFTHPIAVALILLDHTQDQDTVVGALLHDTVEDTSLSITQIKALFGDNVAFIVSKVTNLEDNLRRISLDDHENLHRLTNCEDNRVTLVKLSDRLHNMRTIKHHPSLNKQKNIANETLSFFVPMAKQLNRVNMATELEILCVEVLNKKE